MANENREPKQRDTDRTRQSEVERKREGNEPGRSDREGDRSGQSGERRK